MQRIDVAISGVLLHKIATLISFARNDNLVPRNNINNKLLVMNKLFYIIGTILIIGVFFIFQNKSTITGDDNKIIPRKVLFGNPDKARVSLTHDGK